MKAKGEKSEIIVDVALYQKRSQHLTWEFLSEVRCWLALRRMVQGLPPHVLWFWFLVDRYLRFTIGSATCFLSLWFVRLL